MLLGCESTAFSERIEDRQRPIEIFATTHSDQADDKVALVVGAVRLGLSPPFEDLRSLSGHRQGLSSKTERLQRTGLCREKPGILFMVFWKSRTDFPAKADLVNDTPLPFEKTSDGVRRARGFIKRPSSQQQPHGFDQFAQVFRLVLDRPLKKQAPASAVPR